jgi:hypothetical protein
MTAEPTRETLRNLPPPITAAVLEDFSEFAAELDGGVDIRATVAAFGDSLRGGLGLDPAAEIARRIERCVAERRAASFIRLGDGEGNLLGLALGGYPALTDYCLRCVSVRQLGNAEIFGRAAPELLPAFERALRDADLIGFPGQFGTNMMLRRSAHETRFLRPAHGLVSVHRYLNRFADELQLGSKTGGPAGFHRGLLPHYEALISGRRIGIITRHAALESALEARLGASDVDLRTVPGQAAFTSRPGADTGHWPERFRELCRELEGIDPGTLWFVAAGMLGKVYCDVIRSAGGIAVDIGHVADIWAGAETRSYDQAELIAAWSIVR